MLEPSDHPAPPLRTWQPMAMRAIGVLLIPLLVWTACALVRSHYGPEAMHKRVLSAIERRVGLVRLRDWGLSLLAQQPPGDRSVATPDFLRDMGADLGASVHVEITTDAKGQDQHVLVGFTTRLYRYVLWVGDDAVVRRQHLMCSDGGDTAGLQLDSPRQLGDGVWIEYLGAPR